MKTIVIAIKDIESIDQVEFFGPSMELPKLETRVIFTTNPVIKFVDGKVHKNFDILITPKLDDNYGGLCTRLLKPNELCHLPRHPKSLQAYLLHDACAKLNYADSTLKQLRTAVVTGTVDPLIKGGMYVLKEPDGACGSSQLLINTNTVSPLRVAHDYGRIERMSDEHTSTCGITGVVPEQYTIDKFRSDYPDVKFNLDHPRKLDRFGSNGGGFLMTEYVEHIKEYRGIISGQKVYIARRDRTDGDYPQVKCTSPYYCKYDELNDYPGFKKHAKEISEVLWALGLRTGSVDLFLTPDGQWGIFEWCNQYYTNNWSRQLLNEIATEWVTELVANYGKGLSNS